MTSCHGPLIEVLWSRVPEQELAGEKMQMPTFLNFENCQGSLSCSTLPFFFLSSERVLLAPHSDSLPVKLTPIDQSINQSVNQMYRKCFGQLLAQSELSVHVSSHWDYKWSHKLVSSDYSGSRFK